MTEFGHPEAAPRTARRGGEDRRHDAPAAVHHRPAGVAGAHHPAQRGQPPLHRPAAVGVGGHASCASRRARPARTSYGPVAAGSRGSPPRRPAPARRRAAARRACRPAHPQHRDVVARVERDRRRRRAAARCRAAAPCVSSWPATTCALVTTTPSRATQPEPSTPSPHAVPRIFTTLAAAACTCGSRAIPSRGGATLRLRPVDLRERVEARQRVQQRARRRQRLVEPREDLRALDLVADVAVGVHRDRAEDPHHAEPDARRQQRAEHAVDEAEAGQRQLRAQPHAQPLEAGREAGARRAARRPGRTRARTGELRAVGQHEPGQPRPEPGAEREAERARARPSRTPAPTRTGRAGAASPTMIQSTPVTSRDATGGAHLEPRALRRSGILDVVTATSSPRPSPRPPAHALRGAERFAPLAAAALVAFARRAATSGAQHEPAAAARGRASGRPRGSAATTPRCTRCSPTARASARASSASCAPTARRPRRSRCSKLARRQAARGRRTAPTTCRSRCRRGSSAAWRGTVRLPMVDEVGRHRRSTGAPSSSSPACAAASS